MTILKKLLGAFLAVIILMIGIMTFFTINAEGIHKHNQQIYEDKDNIAFFIEKEVDHLRWLNNLSSMFISGEIPSSVDHTACDLGKWYYAYEPQEYNKDIYSALEAPHIKVHSSGHEVVELFKKGRLEEALLIFNSETAPAVQEVQRYLRLLSETERQQVLNYQAEIEMLQSRGMTISILVIVLAVMVVIVITFILNKQI